MVKLKAALSLSSLEFAAQQTQGRGATDTRPADAEISGKWVAGMPRSASAPSRTKKPAPDAAERAVAEAIACRDTPATKLQRMQELEERARLFGDPVKQSAQAKVLERKWLRFLSVYGDEYVWLWFVLLLQRQVRRESSEVSHLLYINTLLFPKEQDGHMASHISLSHFSRGA